MIAYDRYTKKYTTCYIRMYGMRFVRLDNCKEGMIIGKTIYGGEMMLLTFGTVLKQNHIDALHRLGYPGIYIDDQQSRGIDIPEVIDPATHNKARQTIKGLFAVSRFTGFVNTQALIKGIEDVLDEIINQIAANKDAVANITTLKTFDDYTYQHCVDVGVLSILLGQEFQLKKSTLIELGKAAFFHDIGKMFVPKTILNKPSQLTEEEFEIMKKHPELGYECLKNALRQNDVLCNGVLSHHEKFEGGGYPYGVAGDNIPFFARIIAVTDVYDAITSKRAYKGAMTPTEAYEYIMGSAGTHFDPIVVNAFVRKIPPFQIGSSVILSDGNLAIVMENRPQVMMRPVIRLIPKDGSQKEIDGITIDLAHDYSARNLTIVGAL